MNFSGFAGKENREFEFQTLFVGIIFREFHVQYLKVTKMEAIGSFSLLFATNFTEVQQRKKGVNFCWISLEEVCFQAI